MCNFVAVTLIKTFSYEKNLTFYGYGTVLRDCHSRR